MSEMVTLYPISKEFGNKPIKVHPIDVMEALDTEGYSLEPYTEGKPHVASINEYTFDSLDVMTKEELFIVADEKGIKYKKYENKDVIRDKIWADISGEEIPEG